VLVGAQTTDAVPWTLLDQMANAKRVIGTLYGNAQVLTDFPKLVRLAERGLLDLSAMVTQRITLDEVNDGLSAIETGNVVRSVIVN